MKRSLILDELYNLPNKLLNLNEQKYKKRYELVRKNILDMDINLESIIRIDNILDSERINLIEKYSIMSNHNNDLEQYIKHRDELIVLINYYTNTNMNQRRQQLEKKKQLENNILTTIQIEQKILSLDNQPIQQIIYNKYKRLQSMTTTDSEYSKLKEQIDISINLPYESKYIRQILNIPEYLISIRDRLDLELYGMDNVKEEIMMAINHRLINPLGSNTSLALVGKPGVGKTKIISVLAKILGCPFEHISLGGVNDSSFLSGHSYTYEGARPGKIVESLIKMKSNSGILFFDEIDKISSTANGKEVSNQLLHITDFTQNDHYIDRYIPEIPINLSHIWFIFSLNSIADIDPVLSNRLNFIEVSDYTIDDKKNICKFFLIPDAFKKFKIKNKYIFNDRCIIDIINHNNDITGIRELIRTVDKIFNRLSILENSNKTLKNSLSFDIDLDLNISNKILEKLI